VGEIFLKKWLGIVRRQSRRMAKEIKCLYDIGRITEASRTIDELIPRVVELIHRAMPSPEKTGVRITLRDRVYASPDFRTFPHSISEKLITSGETIGLVEIYSERDSPCFQKGNYLIETLVERVGSAVRQLELEQIQEKLIRAERLAAVGELASGVGHELRNPLNVMRNCAYLLKMSLSEKADAEVFKSLEVLDKQIDITNKIITDLLDFTRITPPSPVRVDLKNIINESLSWISVPSQVTIRTSLDSNATVRTDPEQISRVFANIIANGVQAMNARGGELSIETHEEGDFLSIKFRDTGCGITTENLEKIFEPLFTTKPKGIGLGLAISKRLIEENGGRIEVTSRAGQGSTFTVKLPLEKRSQPE
jgi:signal transduction histidine kinase